MELTLPNLPFASFTSRRIKLGDCSSSSCTSPWYFINPMKSKELARVRKSVIFCGLAETAASIVVAATVVGGAATLLARRTKASRAVEVPQKTCEECGGSGICSECRG